MSFKPTLVTGVFGPRACESLSSDLRAIADAVDRGEIVDFVAAWTEDGDYQVLHSASASNALVLSTLLHRKAVDLFFV